MTTSYSPNLLLVETATKTCSVGVYFNGKLNQKSISPEKFVHSELLHNLIQETMDIAGCTPKQLNALVVDLGPGSYTGLRIGVSSIKGLAFALDIPVVGLHATEVIAHGTFNTQQIKKGDVVVPVIDARRMEVYTQLFDDKLSSKSEIEAKIIDENGFEALKTKGSIFISGDAADKIKDYLGSVDQRLVFDDREQLIAENMIQPALDKLKNNDTLDSAYFEPFYLKNFIAGKPKKLF